MKSLSISLSISYIHRLSLHFHVTGLRKTREKWGRKCERGKTKKKKVKNWKGDESEKEEWRQKKQTDLLCSILISRYSIFDLFDLLFRMKFSFYFLISAREPLVTQEGG